MKGRAMSNPQSRTGGPSAATTGTPAQTEQVDSQKGAAANSVGTGTDDGINDAPDVDQSGGKQPTDPVQNG